MLPTCIFVWISQSRLPAYIIVPPSTAPLHPSLFSFTETVSVLVCTGGDSWNVWLGIGRILYNKFILDKKKLATLVTWRTFIVFRGSLSEWQSDEWPPVVKKEGGITETRGRDEGDGTGNHSHPEMT